jgi:hypothetical protein
MPHTVIEYALGDINEWKLEVKAEPIDKDALATLLRKNSVETGDWFPSPNPNNKNKNKVDFDVFVKGTYADAQARRNQLVQLVEKEFPAATVDADIYGKVT